MPYLPRVVDEELLEGLESAGAVILEGPKACGKTATARQVCNSEVRLDTDERARSAARIDPALVLPGARPRLIDEWQLVPDIWHHVRRAVDESHDLGQFILTGSANPADSATRHTGAGRFSRIRMRPMSLYEQGRSTGQVSLSGLLSGSAPAADLTTCGIPEMAELIASGGWPRIHSLPLPRRLKAMQDYVNIVQRTDINQVDTVRTRDPEKVGNLLRSLARHIATVATDATLMADVSAGGSTLARNTLDTYVTALTRLMLIEDQPPWAPHLRSRVRLRTRPKHHFTDPAIAVAALRSNPTQLLNDPNYLGLLFESLVIRDLRIYSQPAGGTVYHYLDSNDVETDAIVDSHTGAWGAFEIKLGQSRIDEGAESLKRFLDNIDTRRTGDPTVLAVVVPDGYTYTRPDGVAVIPITALGP